MRENPAGILYVIATPLGNLQDLSPRALAVLQRVDVVAAEDTRRARVLLSHFQVRKPLESYHGDSGPQKAEKLLRRLRAGEEVAYVSDGGTPGIADPGPELVAAAAAAGLPVVPVPGPCALVTALSVSGFPADRFLFGGFPPRKAGELREYLSRLLASGETVVLYESPHRFAATLHLLAELEPGRPLMIAREMTKQYEEFRRGTAAELAAGLGEAETRGEFVLVIGPGAGLVTAALPTMPAAEFLTRVLSLGVPLKQAATLAQDLGLAGRREAYQLALALRKEDDLAGEK